MHRILIFVAFTLLCMTSVSVIADEHDSMKAVLVTGASSGIGEKITETLANNGFYVYATARKDEDLERLDAMENVSSVRLDVTIPEQVNAAAAFVESQGRGLWGVVNNAGVAFYGPLSDGPESELMLTFDINVYGPYRVNRAFLPMLIASGGRTTTISSISAFIPGNSGSYSMSKAAVEGYTDTLANELEPKGVHVSAVEPGAFKSEIVDKLKARAFELAESGEMELDEDTRKALEESAANRQTMKEPTEVAEAVLTLMTTDNPKRRYMVTPNAEQADITIRSAMQRMLELNEDQPYEYDREGLIKMLDELLAEE
ncbi:MAG TPA: SDR family NAD(P)-dependent oxidoreductase [Xanthomonadales bacterium]|nr:SDR family NAD(P)-dependent oxidoreductase [Xanthomonadales bacterium]